ncbi:dUTP diphosphatase [Rhodohalobacter sp. 614A]|uniref:dUTP diphosphatase n=1 Tax=Rhodohalobacter sp. 614A TaxID=2908649 RepID=UPI00351D4799
MKVFFQQLEHADGLPLPEYETEGAAGFDLRAAITEPVTLEPGKRALIPIGIKLALPNGYEAQIRPRSGLAYKHGITMLNSPGTIDSDYRGEIKVIAINHGEESFTINRGDRIAQMVIAQFQQIEIQKVFELPKTKRGDGGFGSTGV